MKADPMTPIDDGGPAFPHLDESCQRVNATETHPGMSLRDWFAGQAMRKTLEDCDSIAVQRIRELASGAEPTPDDDVHRFEIASRMAYDFADAMLKARKATP